LYKISNLLEDFDSLTEETNLFRAKIRMEKIVRSGGKIETTLVIDGDKTFAADTGEFFWQMLSAYRREDEAGMLKALFSSPLAYSFTAFGRPSCATRR
jgi:hypothetical protein